MKPSLLYTGIAFVLCMALGAVAVSTQRRGKQLTRLNQSLESKLQSLEKQTGALADDKLALERRLSAATAKHEEFQNRIAELQAAGIEKDSRATSTAALKPYQAQAFLGKKPLGLVWIVPRNFKKDEATQRIVYEPEVQLDEKLRAQFVIYQTNYIERTVDRPVVQNNYYQEPYYVYPARYWPGSTNVYRPAQPANPLPSPPPAFNPGNGTIITQPIGTPAEKIRTLPTLPRTQSPGPTRTASL